jgi:hypothetical protein
MDQWMESHAMSGKLHIPYFLSAFFGFLRESIRKGQSGSVAGSFPPYQECIRHYICKNRFLLHNILLYDFLAAIQAKRSISIDISNANICFWEAKLRVHRSTAQPDGRKGFFPGSPGLPAPDLMKMSVFGMRNSVESPGSLFIP